MLKDWYQTIERNGIEKGKQQLQEKWEQPGFKEVVKQAWVDFLEKGGEFIFDFIKKGEGMYSKQGGASKTQKGGDRKKYLGMFLILLGSCIWLFASYEQILVTESAMEDINKGFQELITSDDMKRFQVTAMVLNDFADNPMECRRMTHQSITDRVFGKADSSNEGEACSQNTGNSLFVTSKKAALIDKEKWNATKSRNERNAADKRSFAIEMDAITFNNTLVCHLENLIKSVKYDITTIVEIIGKKSGIEQPEQSFLSTITTLFRTGTALVCNKVGYVRQGMDDAGTIMRQIQREANKQSDKAKLMRNDIGGLVDMIRNKINSFTTTQQTMSYVKSAMNVIIGNGLTLLFPQSGCGWITNLVAGSAVGVAIGQSAGHAIVHFIFASQKSESSPTRLDSMEGQERSYKTSSSSAKGDKLGGGKKTRRKRRKKTKKRRNKRKHKRKTKHKKEKRKQHKKRRTRKH